jgi:hypothetical protein
MGRPAAVISVLVAIEFVVMPSLVPPDAALPLLPLLLVFLAALRARRA